MDKLKHTFNRFINSFKKISNFKIILITYFFVVIFASLILFSPISQTGKNHVDYIDALFVVASAFSDTGLTTLPTFETWSMFGQAIIAILILVGGIGIFALKYYFINFILRRSMSLYSRIILDKERSSNNIGKSLSTIRSSISIIFFLILLSSFILSFVFYFDKGTFNIRTIGSEEFSDPYHNVSESIRFAVFHSISAINNAGFDIIGGKSLMPYYTSYTIQIIFIILFVIGGIGYPVIFDFFEFSKRKLINRNKKFKFSLFTKLSCLTYLIVTIIGLSLAYIFELNLIDNFWNNPIYGSTSEKLFAIFFNTMSTRNAGFSTVEIGDLSPGTLIVFIIMMFIGSAPSSTAGGIRTTTIAVVVLGIWAKIKNTNSIKIFSKNIGKETIAKSNVVFSTSIIIVSISVLICLSSLTTVETNSLGVRDELDIVFEVFSAFGTTGLSTGITKDLNIMSQLNLILVMFIGQLGISSSILVINENNRKEELFNYVKEEILTG
ncbi:MAG: TrkH family potassium uptake protein [Metamycoplasmataceae bacterium]